MTKRTKLDIVETLKAEELGTETKIKNAEIIGVKDIETTYGKKPVLMFKVGEEKNSVFLNQISLSNLVTAFGDEDSKWIGKHINIHAEDLGKATRNKVSIIVTKA